MLTPIAISWPSRAAAGADNAFTITSGPRSPSSETTSIGTPRTRARRAASVAWPLFSPPSESSTRRFSVSAGSSARPSWTASWILVRVAIGTELRRLSGARLAGARSTSAFSPNTTSAARSVVGIAPSASLT